MDQETEKIIAEQMQKLPKDVLAAIVSVDYKKKLQEITQRQRLLIDQAGKLEMETTLVMIGLEPLADYVANIEREIEVSTIRAKEISLDVSENIFKPIRESLRKMNEEAEMEAEEEIDVHPSRDQILNEIEDPSLIGKETNTVEINPKREVETLDEIPYQQDIRSTPEKTETPKPNLLETKMGGMTITSQKIVEATPEIKLPPIEKKRPSSGIDPYREEIK